MNAAPPAPLALAVGDPAGVGPEIALVAAAHFPEESILLYGDATQLERLSFALRLPVVRVGGPDAAPTPGVAVVDAGRCSSEVVSAHAPSAEAGRAQLAALDRAIADVTVGRARALITGPTSKAAVALTGAAFRGQTEHLAGRVGLAADAVTMLFLGDELRTGLVTTHHAVRDVPKLITPTRVARTAIHLAEALIALGPTAAEKAEVPEVVVAGLNPHAGEGGLFGHEEADSLLPGIVGAQREEPFSGGRARLSGPFGAETAFRWAATGRASGVVAMMHDQATIAAKLLDWGTSVNVTWGLPFVRTSVDHGVAYDAARSGEIDARGMVSAIRMAQLLSAKG